MTRGQTRQRLHQGTSDITLLVCLCTRVIYQLRYNCHFFERQRLDEIENVRLNLFSFSLILSPAHYFAAQPKENALEICHCQCQSRLSLGLGKVLSWGFHPDGMDPQTLASLCPGAEGGQEIREVMHFPNTASAPCSHITILCLQFHVSSHLLQSRQWAAGGAWDQEPRCTAAAAANVRSICKRKSFVTL